MKNENDFNKKIILPLIAFMALMLITGGVSFAYYAFTSISNNNTANLNIQFPEKTNKIFDVQKTDCNFNITRAQMTQSACNNTTPQGTGSCQIVVSVNGSAGDTCSFNVLLSNNGTTNVYTKSVTTLASGTFEYAGTLSGTATKAKTQMDTLAGTKLLLVSHLQLLRQIKENKQLIH